MLLMSSGSSYFLIPVCPPVLIMSLSSDKQILPVVPNSKCRNSASYPFQPTENSRVESKAVGKLCRVESVESAQIFPSNCFLLIVQLQI